MFTFQFFQNLIYHHIIFIHIYTPHSIYNITQMNAKVNLVYIFIQMVYNEYMIWKLRKTKKKGCVYEKGLCDCKEK
jgi:hypothetical protein